MQNRTLQQRRRWRQRLLRGIEDTVAMAVLLWLIPIDGHVVPLMTTAITCYCFPRTRAQVPTAITTDGINFHRIEQLQDEILYHRSNHHCTNEVHQWYGKVLQQREEEYERWHCWDSWKVSSIDRRRMQSQQHWHCHYCVEKGLREQKLCYCTRCIEWLDSVVHHRMIGNALSKQNLVKISVK